MHEPDKEKVAYSFFLTLCTTTPAIRGFSLTGSLLQPAGFVAQVRCENKRLSSNSQPESESLRVLRRIAAMLCGGSPPLALGRQTG